MGNASPERKSGCGIFSAFFGRKSKPRRVTSTGSIPKGNPNPIRRIPSTPNTKRRRGGSDDGFIDQSKDQNSEINGDRIVPRPGPNHYRSPYHHQQNQALQVYNNKNQGKKSPGNDQISVARSPLQSQLVYGVAKKVPYGTTGISGELESMIQEHQKALGNGPLVRASANNVMVYGTLGNLRQGGGNVKSNVNANTNTNTDVNILDYLPKTAKEEPTPINGKYQTSVMGNVIKKQDDQELNKQGSLCRAISTRMDPEELKILGNEDYKNGRFTEALALYEAAISIDPNKASYRSNKCAALTALGRLLEAVFECREAIQIEPQYQRAHSRLATLYLRLGDAEKAMYHYKYAGAEADPDVMSKAKKLQGHLNKCTEAKMYRDWNTLLKETTFALSAGADSAPQIFALKAEALLKLQRQEDAEETMQNGPKFSNDECTKFFGPIGYATQLVIRAQVDMAGGRFDDAATAAQLAARLDPSNKEANLAVRRTRAVSTARSNGNELFKLGRYSEACVAYGEGLNHDPLNAVLLCNRAACRSKLGQHEKALDDCSAALTTRPSYKKARLRRADCYFKLQKWEACINECEILLKDSPDDEEARKMVEYAKGQFYNLNGINDVKEKSNDGSGADLIVVVSSHERFRDYVTSRGLSVVLFCNKSCDRQIIQFMEQLHTRYQSVNFLKVQVEDIPSIATSEGVNTRTLPSFKNGPLGEEEPKGLFQFA